MRKKKKANRNRKFECKQKSNCLKFKIFVNKYQVVTTNIKLKEVVVTIINSFKEAFIVFSVFFIRFLLLIKSYSLFACKSYVFLHVKKGMTHK